jgi:hypothetical protein
VSERHQRFERRRYFDGRLNRGYGYGRGWARDGGAVTVDGGSISDYIVPE